MLTKGPLKNTLKLIKKYGAKLINGTIKDKELETLAKQKNFIVNGCNKQEAMIDFVITIAPFLTRQRLHYITSELIEIDLKHSQKNAFWRNNHLSKYFAAYEVIKSSKSQKIIAMPDELKDHILHHQPTFLKRMSNCYNDLSTIFTKMIFPNAVKLVTAKLQNDGEFNLSPRKSIKYKDIINMNDIKNSEKLKKCLNEFKKRPKSPSKLKTNTKKTHPLINTSAFKKLKKSIKTITNRSTYKDLLKAHRIQQIVNAIEENKSNEEILQIIADNEKDIIKNTGTGFYSLFNCGCCRGYQSKSHKLLDKIKNTLENPKPSSEKTKLLNCSINNI